MPKTYIFISNKAVVLPSVSLIRDGHFTGSTTSLGFDPSHKRALEIAQDYASTYQNSEILDYFDKDYSLAELQDILSK